MTERIYRKTNWYNKLTTMLNKEWYFMSKLAILMGMSGVIGRER